MFHRDTTSVFDFYRAATQKVKEEILRESDETIIGTDVEELTEYYYAKTALTPIVLDENQAPQMQHTKELRTVRSEQREPFYREEGDIRWEYETLHVTLPIEPTPYGDRMKRLQPSTYSVSWSPREVHIDSDYISFVLDIKGYGFSMSDDQIEGQIKWQRDRIREWLGWLKTDIDRSNTELRQTIKATIEQRRQKLQQDQERIAALTKRVNIQLKPKEDQPARKIKLDTKPVIKKIKPKASAPVEYELDREKVLGIVSVLDNQGRQFEKTPKTYESLGEEALRDILLVNLNSVFEGTATGETFSHTGKTDIHLNLDKGNILVCECKIWGGKSLLLDTIGQLLRYLTWRHNFGIVITFVRQKNFSQMLETAAEAISTAPSYKTGFKKIAATHFSALHHHPDDSGKETEIYYLFYNLYTS